MKAKLMSHWGAEKGAEFWIGAEAGIGRGADNEVRLDAKPVSSQHARVFFDPEAGAYFLEDLGSLNGTEIDGTPVERVERLGRLHVLNFAGVCEMLFVTVDTRSEAQVPAPPATGTQVEEAPPVLPGALAEGEGKPRGVTRIEEAPVALPAALADGEPASAVEEKDEEPPPAAAEPPPRAAAASGYILSMVDEGAPRRFTLRRGENLVGRTRSAQIVLASPQLSRRHAVLTVASDRVTVRDLGSRNHTFVEDRELEPETEVEIHVRSRLRFGLLEAYLLRLDEGDQTLPVERVDEG